MKSAFEGEQKHGGIIKGFFGSMFRSEETRVYPQSTLGAKSKAWSVWSLQDGLETLPKAIYQDLKGRENIQIESNAVCEKLEFSDDGVHVFVNGKDEIAEHVYCSLPSNQLAKILPRKFQKLGEELEGIPFVNVGVVNLEFEGDVLPVNGFGFLVPPNQNLDILGVIFDSCCFPQVRGN